MATDPTMLPLELLCKPRGRAGKAAVTIRNDKHVLATDTGDLCSERWRAEFADKVKAQWPGVDRDGLLTELTRLAGELVERTARAATQSAELVALASDVELFHVGDKPYATAPVEPHRETWPTDAKCFRLWLTRRYYVEHGRPPAALAMHDALRILAGRALFDGPEAAVAVRLAECDGAYWLDLANAERQAVRVDPTGWRVVSDPPVRFLRPRGLLPLPVPVAGDSVAQLRQFLNVPDDNDLALLLGWLIAALRPVGPYPVLCVSGEQGSAKSTLCRLLRALVDPNLAALRAEPRDARDLMIAANNGWLVALDNVSALPPWLSDAICRLSTGGGFATRELYSDDAERIFDSMRPTLINGIEDVVSRGDLLDRAVTLLLPTIPENRRRTEAKLWADFEAARPQVLGALLNAVAAGLKNLPSVKLDRLPRMADFAQWAVACEAALELPKGAFMRAYTGNRAAGHEVAVEWAAIGPPLVRLVNERGLWTGTAAELLAELASDSLSDERTRGRRDWPATPRKLGADLRRLAPNLRARGINLSFERRPDKDRTRIIRLDRAGAESSGRSEPSETPRDGLQSGLTSDADGPTLSEHGPPRNAGGWPANAVSDGSDGSDGMVPVSSRSNGDAPAGLLPQGLSALPPAVADLVTRRPGWTTSAWAIRCRQLAERCRNSNPQRADELEMAAGFLEQGGHWLDRAVTLCDT